MNVENESLPRCCGCHKGCDLIKECDNCQKKFRTKSLLNKHKQDCYSEIRRKSHEKPHVCSKCNKKFAKPLDLDRHIKFKHGMTFYKN